MDRRAPQTSLLQLLRTLICCKDREIQELLHGLGPPFDKPHQLVRQGDDDVLVAIASVDELNVLVAIASVDELNVLVAIASVAIAIGGGGGVDGNTSTTFAGRGREHQAGGPAAKPPVHHCSHQGPQ
ncbi:unnamed protein product [Urochloa humidicola]